MASGGVAKSRMRFSLISQTRSPANRLDWHEPWIVIDSGISTLLPTMVFTQEPKRRNRQVVHHARTRSLSFSKELHSDFMSYSNSQAQKIFSKRENTMRIDAFASYVIHQKYSVVKGTSLKSITIVTENNWIRIPSS